MICSQFPASTLCKSVLGFLPCDSQGLLNTLQFFQQFVRPAYESALLQMPCELHVVLVERVLEALRIAEIAEPVLAAAERALGNLEHHRLDAGEAGLAGDLDHVVEFVVVTFAGALHEPGINFGAELNFAHGDGVVELVLCLENERKSEPMRRALSSAEFAPCNDSRVG